MNLETVLKTEIVSNHIEFLNASKMSQKLIIRKLIKSAVTTALKTINLPPLKDAFQQKMDEYKYRRRNEQFRLKHKLPNYRLLERLYQLQNKDVKTDGTDFLSNIKLDYSSLGRRILDLVSNTERKTHVDYDNYSKNHLPKESCFFKFYNIDYSIFDSEKDTRNEITRFKFKLLDPIKKSILIEQANNVEVIQESILKKQRFSENLFILYDLQSFLNFVKILEKRTQADIALNESKDYAFQVLHEYYFEIFKSHGYTFESNQTIEYILQNDEFRELSDENPLTQGFIMLLSNSLDISQIIKQIESERK